MTSELGGEGGCQPSMDGRWTQGEGHFGNIGRPVDAWMDGWRGGGGGGQNLDGKMYLTVGSHTSFKPLQKCVNKTHL